MFFIANPLVSFLLNVENKLMHTTESIISLERERIMHIWNKWTTSRRKLE